MSVRQFREWLATQDQEAVVQILSSQRGFPAWENFDPELYSAYEEPLVKESDPRKNIRWLQLGYELITP